MRTGATSWQLSYPESRLDDSERHILPALRPGLRWHLRRPQQLPARANKRRSLRDIRPGASLRRSLAAAVLPWNGRPLFGRQLLLYRARVRLLRPAVRHVLLQHRLHRHRLHRVLRLALPHRPVVLSQKTLSERLLRGGRVQLRLGPVRMLPAPHRPRVREPPVHQAPPPVRGVHQRPVPQVRCGLLPHPGGRRVRQLLQLRPPLRRVHARRGLHRLRRLDPHVCAPLWLPLLRPRPAGGGEHTRVRHNPALRHEVA
mmetsp:Transcript_10041/g.22306  ORF Transcript_10041/g.22306 Transcript_10041/m.22306 type:complete len:257 (+) Transcript_10041:173-943(+)